MKKFIRLMGLALSKLLCALILFCYSLSGEAQTVPPKRILIKNANIFNGIDDKIYEDQYILIEKNLIKAIGHKADAPTDVDEIIDGKGYYVMPGLIDAHVHLMQESVSQTDFISSDFVTINFLAAEAAERQLMRGFTTVRDLGGGALALARAIDRGLVVGPRVFPSGAFISQTGGHGDFGLPTDVPRDGTLTYYERQGVYAIADGVAQVLQRSREQLRQGATQLKLMAGGGISSAYDPLDVSQYSTEEFAAAVGAAKDWGTYVTVHAYTDEAVQRAIHAGVKSIEHGHMIEDEATVQLMAEKAVWWSMQPFYYDTLSKRSPKNEPVYTKSEKVYDLARKYGVKMAFGADLLFSKKRAATQGQRLAALSTRFEFSPFETLKMATSQNAEFLRMSGKRNPYLKGRFGEITEGAYADLLIVNGDPLKDISLIEKPDKNFLLIMKDGKVYKNLLHQKQ